VNHMANKRNLDKMSIYISQKKMAEKPVERLIRLGNKKDRSINYLVVGVNEHRTADHRARLRIGTHLAAKAKPTAF